MGPGAYLIDESFDFAGARLLMDLLRDKGTDWTFMAWMNGQLAGLLEINRYL
jgi:hypothetical protein